MSKQVEVPEGVKRLDPDFDYEEMEPSPAGDYIRVSDLPALYEHFSDRLLSKGAVDGMAASLAANDGQGHWALVENKEPYRLAARAHFEDALQATSTPEVDRG